MPWVQCDVVPTKDCFLICRHEPELNLTTDASKYYSDLAKTYEIDGSSVTVSDILTNPNQYRPFVTHLGFGALDCLVYDRVFFLLFSGDIQH